MIDPMIEEIIMKPVSEPWMRDFPLKYPQIQHITGQMVVSDKQLTMPNVTIKLLFEPLTLTATQLDFNLVSVENTHFEKHSHVLEKVCLMAQ